MKRIGKFTKLIFIIFLLAISNNALAEDERIYQANDLYMEGDYEAAIELYEEVLLSDLVSADLYYNLGNAYYRQGYLPSAILNYERALLMAPHDRDIRHNLNLAYGQITDNIEPLHEFFLTRWLISFRNIADSNSWALISVISFIIFLTGMLLYFFSKNVTFRKLCFFLAVFAILISAIGFSFSSKQKRNLIEHKRAIVFSPSVTVRSSPDARSTELFVLHSGTRVFILQQIDQWFEIEIDDGHVGWMHAEHLEII